MSREIVTLQKLLNVLDDTSTLYRRLAPKTTGPHLKLLLQRTAKAHQWIADDLAERMTATGGSPKREGSLLGPLRAQRAKWLARISPDIELAYAIQAERCEDGVLQRFDEAVAEVTDAELCNLLQVQRRELERACTQIECLGSSMRAHTKPAPRPIRAAVRRPEARTIVQTRSQA
jgi:uncharacterized protein (TIGR02284 family)